MPDFTWWPDGDTPEQTTPRTLEVEFGDGYSQRALDGINALPRSWNLTFRNRTEAEADAIDAFLRSKAGVTAFTLQPPSSAAQATVICKSWTRTEHANIDFVTVRATFLEVFA